jgi:hypothetical protein
MLRLDRPPGARQAVSLVIREITSLPNTQGAGPLSAPILELIAKLALERDVRVSVETGAGVSTLLLSHLSARHIVFSVGAEGRLDPVRRSPLLRSEVVEFVEGPTQSTLCKHDFDAPVQLVLLDGPHAYPFPELEYYCLYPHLEAGGLLIVDNIEIPTVYNLFRFLREEAMFRLHSVVNHAAFFVRTEAPTFHPFGDGWEQQAYNRRRYPLDLDRDGNVRPALVRMLGRLVPGPVRAMTRGWPSRWLRTLAGDPP